MKRKGTIVAACAAGLLVALVIAVCLFPSADMLPDVSHRRQMTTHPRVTYAQKAVRTFLPDDTHVRPVGRTLYYDDVRWFSLSGCGLEFSCFADMVDITFSVAQSAAVRYNHRPRVAVLVNEELAADAVLDEDGQVIHLDLNGTEEEAVIRVVKLSESMHSCAGVSQISVLSSAEILPTLREKPLIEFIGDSITAGYGLDEDRPHGQYSTRTANYLETYASLTAQALGAESYAVAFSGYGVLSAFTTNGVIRSELVLSNRYGKTLTNLPLPESVSADWTFLDPQSDLIVINLGTNDASYCTTAMRRAQFVEAYQQLLFQIRQTNQTAPIVCILGDMNNSMYPYIEQAVEEFRLETEDDAVFCTSVTFDMEHLGSTIDGHPNRQSNILAAETLTDFLWKHVMELF